MDKSQHIYNYGLSVTITRNDGTTYPTYMLYRTISRDKGSMTDNGFTLSNEYMRGGVFRPTDDIQDGYMVRVNKSGETLFISAHQPQSFMGEIQSIFVFMVLLDFPNQVTWTPSQADTNVTRDKFGRPTPLASSTIGVIVTQADLVIKPDVSGGKPTELLQFYTQNSTIKENDEIIWNNNTFRVTTAFPYGFAATSHIVLCKAQREVDL